MNILEAAIHEQAEDSFRYLKTQYLELSPIVPADDFLQVSALLNNNGKRLSVAENFVDVMEKLPGFNRTISGYIHTETGVYYAPGQLTQLANKSLYTPTYALTCKPDEYTVLIYDRNTFFINIHKLAHFAGSRQKALIDTLVNCEVFVHNAKVADPTAKHKRDSMAVILKRDFKPNTYEWGLSCNGELSKIILPAVLRGALPSDTPGTYYLYRGNKRIQCKIKVYNVTARDDRKGQPYQYIVGDIMKFEVTFQREFFIHHGYATTAKFKTQTDSFNILVADILKQFSQHLLNKLSSFEKKQLLKATGTKTIGEFMQKHITPESLQTNRDNDLFGMKKIIQGLAGYLRANTAATNANTIATDAHTAALLANTAALTAANDKTHSLAEFNEFVTQQEKQIDKRKLRIVR